MPIVRTLVRNIVSNWVGYAVQVCLAFVLTPFVLHSLGETKYGIWAVAVGVTGYYGLLDLGFSAGMTQYFTRYLAEKDFASLNKTASTGFVTLASCGVVIFIASILIALNVSALFRIPPESSRDACFVLAITGASMAFGFVFSTYSAVFTAVQRFDLSNGIGIATRLTSAVATVLCLNNGYGLVAISLVGAGANVLDYLFRWRVAYRLLPTLRVSIALAEAAKFGEVIRFGIWNVAIGGSVRLISYTDSLVIAAFLPAAAIAPFAIAANLRTYFEDIFVRVGYVFYPVVTGLDARGDRSGLIKLFLVSTKFMFLGAVICGSIAICLARYFFRLWVGPVFADPVGYPSIAIIFYTLILGSIVGVGQRIGYQVLLGTRQVSVLAKLFVAEGISNLVVSIALIPKVGLIGVAMGTLIPAIVFQGFLQPFVVCRSLRISAITYVRQVLSRPVCVVILFGPLLAFLSRRVGSIDNWRSLFVCSALSILLALPIIYWVGLNYEDRELLARPITRAWIRLQRALLPVG